MREKKEGGRGNMVDEREKRGGRGGGRNQEKKEN
jgi:hypothetical protein